VIRKLVNAATPIVTLLMVGGVSSAGELYGASDVGLYSIDTSSAALTYIGPLNIATGLAGNPIDGELYLTAGGSPSQLAILDPDTAAGTLAGSFDVPGISGLSYNPNDGCVYGSQTSQGGGNSLYKFDLATGDVTEVGLFPSAGTPDGYTLSITGLAFDPNSSTLYGTTCNGRVYTVDLGTANTIAEVGSFGYFVAGLAYAPDSGLLYATTTFPNDNLQLIAMDPASGAVAAIGQTKVDDTNIKIFGLAYMSDAVIAVDIDIKPGSFPNPINLGSNGLVPVAILSSVDFDATTVDESTVELAGAMVAIRGKNRYLAAVEDVNGDQLPDLVCHVETQNLVDEDMFQDGYALVTGETFLGQSFEGWDEITIVPRSE